MGNLRNHPFVVGTLCSTAICSRLHITNTKSAVLYAIFASLEKFWAPERGKLLWLCRAKEISEIAIMHVIFFAWPHNKSEVINLATKKRQSECIWQLVYTDSLHKERDRDKNIKCLEG